MSEIKTKHLGGFTARKPGVAHNAGHPEQKPGAAAGGVKTGDMSWKGRKK
jgi:hypothetical protein